jgi:hypothetical protein
MLGLGLSVRNCVPCLRLRLCFLPRSPLCVVEAFMKHSCISCHCTRTRTVLVVPFSSPFFSHSVYLTHIFMNPLIVNFSSPNFMIVLQTFTPCSLLRTPPDCFYKSAVLFSFFFSMVRIVECYLVIIKRFVPPGPRSDDGLYFLVWLGFGLGVEFQNWPSPLGLLSWRWQRNLNIKASHVSLG